MKLVPLLAALAMLTACANKADERTPAVTWAPDQPTPAAPGAAPAATAPSPSPPTPAIPGDFPRACSDYAALIERLKSCDQLGGARAGLVGAYDSLREAWSTVPAERRDELARQCAAQAESVRNAAAATCAL